MAEKEIAIKIKLDGKELELGKTSINDFKKAYQEAQKKLDTLPLGSPEWKELNREIKNADKSFQQTKEILTETEGKFKSLKVQIRQATLAFQEAEEKGDLEGMKKAKQNIDDLNDKLEVSQLKSMKFTDALATMPGVAGFVGQSIQGVDKSFKVLLANPILATITAIVGAFMFLKEALGKTSEGQEALNKVQQAFSKILGPILALINTVAIPIFEKLAEIISFVGEGFSWLVENLGISSEKIAATTKDIDEVGKELAEKEKQRQEDLKKQKEEEKKKREEAAKAAIEEAQKKKEAAQEQINLNEELKQSETELSRSRIEKSEDELEEIKKRRNIIDEDYLREKKRIEDLMKLESKNSNEYKRLIIELNSLDKDYTENKRDLSTEEKEILSERAKAQKEFNDQITDLQIELIKDEQLRETTAVQEKLKRDLQNLEMDKQFIAKSETEKLEIRKLYEQKAEEELEKIRQNRISKEKENQMKAIDVELKILEYRNMVLAENTSAYFRNSEEILKLNYEKEKLLAEGNAQLLLEINNKYLEDKKNLQEQEIAAYGELAARTFDAIAGLSSAIAGTYDEEAKTSITAFNQRKKLLKATALLNAASGVIQVLTAQTTVPEPFGSVLKGIAATALIIKTNAEIKKINEVQFEGAASEGAKNLGKNYAQGGFIKGPRHAQGGVMIEAEGGEAVMTRGAVTMFGPLLSAMNQMGGGTSFANNLVSSPDVPETTSSAMNNATPIIKTYVVSSELTSEAERQARLKDLSVL